MPKSPKSRTVEMARHNPLVEDYSPSHPFRQKASKKRRRRSENDEEERVIGTKASRKILKIGQELADEADEESKTRYITPSNPAFSFESRLGDSGGSDEDQDKWDNDEAWADEEEEVLEVEEIDPKDLDTFDRFNPPSFDDPILRPGEAPPDDDGGTRNLADIILAKIAAHESAQGARPEEPEIEEVELDPKVIETYTILGTMLSRYRSGKLPKAFKILPSLPLPTLLAILPLTNPSKWTPHAIFYATRLFISSNSPISQSFLNNILLDRVREEIYETRRLNIHLYNAMKKALYKPKDFFKGFLFPLLSSGTCTLREAHIISSVLVRVSVPVIHSAVALSKLCEIAAEQMSMDTEAAGATNIFIKVLLEKKYALPFQTIDALVFHFLRFRPVAECMELDGDSRRPIDGRLPVIWHQCLLAFAQRYRDSITEDQREALLDLLLVKGHKDIGPEVRRELLAGRGRGVVAEEPQVGDGGDDTMMGVEVAQAPEVIGTRTTG